MKGVGANGTNGSANGTQGKSVNGDSEQLAWTEERDFWWHEEMEDVDSRCYPVWMAAEDPLFMLYTRYKKKKKIHLPRTIPRVECAVIRFCFSVVAVRRENPKEFSTQPRDISSTQQRLSNMFLITIRMTCTGAQPTSDG